MAENDRLVPQKGCIQSCLQTVKSGYKLGQIWDIGFLGTFELDYDSQWFQMVFRVVPLYVRYVLIHLGHFGQYGLDGPKNAKFLKCPNLSENASNRFINIL